MSLAANCQVFLDTGYKDEVFPILSNGASIAEHRKKDGCVPIRDNSLIRQRGRYRGEYDRQVHRLQSWISAIEMIPQRGGYAETHG